MTIAMLKTIIKQPNYNYLGTAIYTYSYMFIVAVLCFIYIGLYKKLEQEKYM